MCQHYRFRAGNTAFREPSRFSARCQLKCLAFCLFCMQFRLFLSSELCVKILCCRKNTDIDNETPAETAFAMSTEKHNLLMFANFQVPVSRARSHPLPGVVA